VRRVYANCSTINLSPLITVRSVVRQLDECLSPVHHYAPWCGLVVFEELSLHRRWLATFTGRVQNQFFTGRAPWTSHDYVYVKKKLHIIPNFNPNSQLISVVFIGQDGCLNRPGTSFACTRSTHSVYMSNGAAVNLVPEKSESLPSFCFAQ